MNNELTNARDRARAHPSAPCFVEVRDKHAPSSNISSLLRAPGNRTVCKEGKTAWCRAPISFLRTAYR